MRLSLAMLQDFWSAAAESKPLLIVGAGRWGRVWASVAAKARGGADGIVLVARRNFAETAAWRDQAWSSLRVAESIDAGLAALPGAPCAIIASQPRDHVVDALKTLEAGAPTLVEKPFSDDPRAAHRLLEAARARGALVSLGVEFALLPAFHQLANALVAQGRRFDRAQIIWSDPRGEARHGEVKRTHDETGVLEDLLPHALSVLRIFAPAQTWRLDDAAQSPDGHSGSLSLSGPSLSAELRGDRVAAARQRRLVLFDGTQEIASVDFVGAAPAITLDGAPLAADSLYAALDSSLRLELGAFLRDISLCEIGAGPVSPISCGLESYIDLHAALRARGIGATGKQDG